MATCRSLKILVRVVYFPSRRIAYFHLITLTLAFPWSSTGCGKGIRMLKISNRALISVSLGALTAITLGTGSASASAQLYAPITNYKSGTCLSLANGGSTANNVSAILYTCSGASEQSWEPSGSTYVNFKSGKCLSLADGGSTANGTKAIQYTCNGQPEQDWYLRDGQLKSGKDFSKCLSTQSGGTANNTNVVIYDCNGAPEQQWSWLF
ncbi:ricin-type beta-trefoil lectin domain protein [Streptomyces adustus]|uniref:Ricin-type beta-trefoil lectin domain protein n=2 Tax=Streptomyces adustus TaxID=1609272 RepID=A0A5N8V6V4_9ACTN|nr:ricin-type beta-trefoil lectin domain protein [Streptomyces adustus]